MFPSSICYLSSLIPHPLSLLIWNVSSSQSITHHPSSVFQLFHCHRKHIMPCVYAGESSDPIAHDTEHSGFYPAVPSDVELITTLVNSFTFNPDRYLGDDLSCAESAKLANVMDRDHWTFGAGYGLMTLNCKASQLRLLSSLQSQNLPRSSRRRA